MGVKGQTGANTARPESIYWSIRVHYAHCMGASGARQEKTETLASALAENRRERFVGREGELDLIATELLAPDSAIRVVFFHGPGGVGKSSLLSEATQLARESGRTVVEVDMRTIDPSPVAFEQAFEAAGGKGAQKLLLVIDTFEAAAQLEEWLRGKFLPKLDADAAVLIAGRRPPGPGWRTDPGWSGLLRVISLRNLDLEASRALVRRAGVDETRGEAAIALTRGHPLALALLADQLSVDPSADVRSDLTEVPDLLGVLLERLVSAAPSERQAETLALCALSQFTTESLLREVLGGNDAEALFEWLRSLSIIGESSRGLFPHDLARDVISSDLRRRDPDRNERLLRDSSRYLTIRALRTTGTEQLNMAGSMIFLLRGNPALREFWAWDEFDRAYAEPFTTEDGPALLAMTESQQGSEAAEHLERWLEVQPGAFRVMRTIEEPVRGFHSELMLDVAPSEAVAADPGTAACLEYAQRRGLQPGEKLIVWRHLLDSQLGQGRSPTLNLTTVINTQRILTRAPETAIELVAAFAEPDQANLDAMTAFGFRPAPEANYEIGGIRYCPLVHDWRQSDLGEWLRVTGARARDFGSRTLELQVDTQPLALAREDFEIAVKGALADLHRPERLARNPLLAGRLVASFPAKERPDALGALIETEIAALAGEPRGEKPQRALDRTFLRPAATREAAAEALDLPFSTYRRHLAQGIQRLTERLWQLEITA